MSNIKVKVSITQVLITILSSICTQSPLSGVYLFMDKYTPLYWKIKYYKVENKSLLILFACVPWFIVAWFFILPLIFQVSHPDLFPYFIIVFLWFSAHPPLPLLLSSRSFSTVVWSHALRLIYSQPQFLCQAGQTQDSNRNDAAHFNPFNLSPDSSLANFWLALSLTRFSHRLHWLHSYYIVVRCLNCYWR